MSNFDISTAEEKKDVSAAVTFPFPFVSDVHLLTPRISNEHKEQYDEIVSKLRNEHKDLCDFHAEWLFDDEHQIYRFMIARNFHTQQVIALLVEALNWRSKRRPSDIENQPNWSEIMSTESETGKIYCPGVDQWGRSVLVLNNSVQNTKSDDDHMVFLAWNLEFAIKTMSPSADKYLVFVNLENFSLFNNPSMNETLETLKMLSRCYPERLGHAIAYQPPTIFPTVFNAVKMFLDPKTTSKIVFISGDVSDGSKNDLELKSIIGDNWKILTGAEQPVVVPGCSPGYDHSKHWPSVLARLETLK
mmetsp:Transcript_15037/g.25074  ORF Transcript_15037/g.25074 Transcript_15037/m.25074 type:complete len:303 (+) Transcript_15037:243-1151(+)